MNFKHLAILLFMMIAVTGLLIGCAGQQATVEEQPPQQVEEPPPPDTTGYAQRVADSLAQVQNDIKERERQQAAARLEEERKQALLKEERDIATLQIVYFDFDKSNLLPSERNILQKNAEILMKYPKWQVVVEGHCDERGSTEYNLALGERRAATVKQYYQDFGIDPKQIKIISYGEERPAVQGHSEKAWAKNRRAVTLVK